MYIRVAYDHPLRDNSVVGWLSNELIVEEVVNRRLDLEVDGDHLANPLACFAPEDLMAYLAEDGWVIEFSSDELAAAIATSSPDDLPKIHVGAVCCFESDSIYDWVQERLRDIERRGYDLSDDALRVWAVEGEERDVNDFEGVYVIAEAAEDITEEVQAEIAADLARGEAVEPGEERR